MTQRWLSVGELAPILGTTPQGVRKRLKRALRCPLGDWTVREVPGRGGRSGVRYEVALSSLPEAIQKAFRDQNPDACDNVSQASPPMALALPAPAAPHLPRVATAEETRRALALFKQIEPATREGLTSRERGLAVRQIVQATGLPRKTVYTHLQRYQQHGLEGLLRRRPVNAGEARCAVSMSFDRAFIAAGHPADLLPELGAFVTENLKGLWKGQAADGGENDIGRLAGFLLFERCEELNAPMPLEACVIGRRRVREFRRYKMVNIRDNDAAQFRAMLPTIRRDWTRFAPMEIVIADVKHLDVLVTREDGSKAYPKLIGFMDGGTGRVFAYLVLCPERRSISQKLVIEAFIAMCQHEHWGFPKRLYLDNGSEFGGLDRIIPAISLLHDDAGRQIIRAQPYNANSKPIEALFARLDRYCFSALPGYTGPDRTNKKTQNVGRDPVAWSRSWADFCSTVGGLIDYYHARQIGGQWGGKSCNQTFQSKVDAGWRPTFPHPLALEIAFCERKAVKFRNRAITHDGKQWWHPMLANLVKGDELELLLPWQVDEGPVALVPGMEPFRLIEDLPYSALDLSGSQEAGRRRQGFRRAVAEMDREVALVDPVETKMRMAKRIDRPRIPGNPRFLDQGATIHQFPPPSRQIGAQIEPDQDAAARNRKLERRRTERLERARNNGR